MLTLFRRFLDTWLAKLFFLVLVASFGVWGVKDVITNLGGKSSLAVVGSRKIELPEAQEAYRQQLAQVTRMFGTQVEPTPEIKRSVAAQALERLITTAALQNAASNMGVAVPDEALRLAIYDIPSFRGPTGVFDRSVFETVLRNNGLTERRFLDLLRSDLAQKQMLEAVRVGAISPDVMTREVFAFQKEQRVASAVSLLFAAAKPPEAPSRLQLERYYDNNKSRYESPEFRRIRAVVLAAETLAKDIEIPEADIAAAFASRKAEFHQPEKRTVDVLLASSEEAANKLAETWRLGLDWAAIKVLASKSGVSGVELADAAEQEFPAPELGAAVFNAAPDTVAPPVHSALGWHVFKVTGIQAEIDRTLAEVTPELRDRLATEKATDLVYERANKVEELLGAGTSLDDLPGDLGLAAVAGSMDAKGNTLEGKPAPIPGPADLRAALIQAAFQAKKGDAPHLTQTPQVAGQASAPQSYFAVQVEDITPPAAPPLDEVISKVTEDWTRDAVRHVQEAAAAAILQSVKSGTTLQAAATAAGLESHELPPVGRSGGVDGVPSALINPLFSLKRGEPTMVETPEGFMVAVLDKIITPDKAADPIGYDQTRTALAKAFGDDAETVFATAMRERAKPQVNRAQLDQLSQPSGTE